MQVEEQFLTPTCVHNNNLVLNIEGYGRYRLWFSE